MYYYDVIYYVQIFKKNLTTYLLELFYFPLTIINNDTINNNNIPNIYV